MLIFCLIFIGSGLGGVCRYIVSTSTYALIGQNFPYGTLLVNALGSFFIGFLYVILLDRMPFIASNLRVFLLIGFLGGFTTFSTFSLETLNLFESGAWLQGSLNIIISVCLCLVLTWAGFILGRQL